MHLSRKNEFPRLQTKKYIRLDRLKRAIKRAVTQRSFGITRHPHELGGNCLQPSHDLFLGEGEGGVVGRF